jgi:hypothetical protein
VGRSISDGEAQGMVSEAPGPVNFTQMVILFAEKMAGGQEQIFEHFALIKMDTGCHAHWHCKAVKQPSCQPVLLISI